MLSVLLPSKLGSLLDCLLKGFCFLLFQSDEKGRLCSQGLWWKPASSPSRWIKQNMTEISKRNNHRVGKASLTKDLGTTSNSWKEGRRQSLTSMPSCLPAVSEKTPMFWQPKPFYWIEQAFALCAMQGSGHVFPWICNFWRTHAKTVFQPVSLVLLPGPVDCLCCVEYPVFGILHERKHSRKKYSCSSILPFLNFRDNMELLQSDSFLRGGDYSTHGKQNQGN